MHEFNLNNVEGLEWVCVMIKKKKYSKTIEDYWRKRKCSMKVISHSCVRCEPHIT